jgi:SanA protein
VWTTYKRCYKSAMAVITGLFALGGLTLLGPSAYVHWTTRHCVFSLVDDVPQLETAIVLGCAPTLGDGRPNYYFETRLDAAAELYRTGRVARLIVSGGPLRRDASGTAFGSECDAMRDGLLARGVLAERIVLDTSGTRTRQSAQRARGTFRLRAAVFVTQPFHAPRAVFLARQAGIDAFAYTAASPSLLSRTHSKVLVREVFACVRAVLEATTKKYVPGC